MALDAKILDEMAQKLAGALPPGIKDFQQDMEKNFRAVLQGVFARMELVTREEFDVQTDVLGRTRAKLAALEKQVADIEAKLAGHEAPTARVEREL